MTVTVYVWLPRMGSVGHASMELQNGTYISLWPGEGKMGKKKKKKKKKDKKGKSHRDEERSDSLADDIESEERIYDLVYRISGLNERDIERWWAGFDTRWSLLSQNCCKTVIDGLRAGGSERKLNFVNKLYFGVTLLWTPLRVATYCSMLV